MNKSLEHLRANGFEPRSMELDGKVHRFDRGGKNNAWYIGWLHYLARTGEPYEVCYYGDWKTGEEHTFKTAAKYSREDRETIDRRLKEAARQAALDREQRQEEAAGLSSQQWDRAVANRNNCPYLDRKKIEGLLGTKTELNSNGRAVLVPMRDFDSKLWGLQRIMPDGSKFFQPGQRVQGCFHLLGEGVDADTLFICEGFATGASIYQATGKPVFVAFNASNLEPVAREVRRRYPDSAIIIAGDDDRWNEINQGKEKAQAAAKACLGTATLPHFARREVDARPTDFNDLHLMEGLDEVRRQLLEQEPERNFVKALGYDGEHYYYTSSSNAKIVRLSASAHTAAHLQDLMPNAYWETLYPGRQGINWQLAASDLMEQGRARGYFSSDKIRGIGVWDDGGRVVLNLGDRLWCEGRETPLASQKMRGVYQMGRVVHAPPQQAMSDQEAHDLIDTVAALNWKRRESRAFFAGFLAVCRLSGLMKWRPHLWLTGGAGTGKTTVMEHLVRPFVGDYGLFVLGNTTEAGIRQSMGPDSRAVVFDEIETMDERSDKRIKGILDLVRQASSDSEAVIAKGGSDGSASHFRLRSAFVFSSIRVNLQSEADATRFTVCELARGGSREQWERLKTKLENVTTEYADRLFARSLALWPVIRANTEGFERVLSRRYSARFAQQYGILLAGFASLTSDQVLEQPDLEAICDQFVFEEESQVLEDTDEAQALDTLMCQRVTVDTPQGRQDRTVAELVKEENDAALSRYGLRVKRESEELAVYVANAHPELERLFHHTKWCAGWAKSLARVQGAHGSSRAYFGHRQQRCVRIPLRPEVA